MKNLYFKKPMLEAYITVIIPVYNNVEGLRLTLTSLAKQDIGREHYEIIVANDGDDLEITQLCKRLSVSVVRIWPNHGSYFARNRAIEESRGEYLAFVDADITVPENWLSTGLKKLRQFHYIAGNVIVRYDKPSLLYYYQYHKEFPIEKFMRERKFGPTANLFVSRFVMEKSGGFDERLRSGADFEFGDRLYRYFPEFSQSYALELVVFHPPKSLSTFIKKQARITRGIHDLQLLYPGRFNYIKQEQRVSIRRIISIIKTHSYYKDKKYSFFIKFLFDVAVQLLRKWWSLFFLCIPKATKKEPSKNETKVEFYKYG